MLWNKEKFRAKGVRRPTPTSRAKASGGERATEALVIEGSVQHVASVIGAETAFDKQDLPVMSLMELDATSIASVRQNKIAILKDGTVISAAPYKKKIVGHYRQQLKNDGFTASIIIATDALINILYDEYDEEKNGDDEDESAELTEEEKSHASRLLDRILIQAHKRNASDIHVEIRPEATYIKNRINSRIESIEPLSHRQGVAIMSVAFGVRARKDFSLNKIQQGSFTSEVEGISMRMRINAQYVFSGSDVVLRELSSTEVGKDVEVKIPSYNELGMGKLHQQILSEAVQRASGLIMFTGPTGSGKTTSIASTINTVPEHLKIYTIEDPVEKILGNSSQVSITADANDKEKLADALREVNKNLLRQDPDVAMVGEVRDLDSARSLVELSTTGHLALATIHTASAIAVLTRIHDMGVSWERLGTPGLFSVIVYQRLVGELCSHCKVPYRQMVKTHDFHSNPDRAYAKDRIMGAMEKIEKEDTSAKIFTADTSGNCEHCRKGIVGRIAAMEMIRVDRACCEIIRTGNLLELERHLKKVGWESIGDHATHLIRKGLVDPFISDELVGPFGNDEDGDCFSYEDARKKIVAKYNDKSNVKPIGKARVDA